MSKVYVFSDETMCLDLLDNDVEEELLEETAEGILEELRLGKVIEINGCYIVGNITACILSEKYSISTHEELLI